MKKQTKKLQLSKETLLEMELSNSQVVAGAVSSIQVKCLISVSCVMCN